MRYALLLVPLSIFLLGGAPKDRKFGPQTYMLAKTCVGEATFNMADCAPIAAVLRNRAAHRGDKSIVSMAEDYSALFKKDSRRKTWVRALPNGFRKPADWPEDIQPWVFVRDRWGRMLVHAHQLMLGKVSHQCTGTPWEWGASYGIDDRRGKAALKKKRWRLIECPGTQNLFYAKGARYPSPSPKQ
jgi:hypothetical protein